MTNYIGLLFKFFILEIKFPYHLGILGHFIHCNVTLIKFTLFACFYMLHLKEKIIIWIETLKFSIIFLKIMVRIKNKSIHGYKFENFQLFWNSIITCSVKLSNPYMGCFSSAFVWTVILKFSLLFVLFYIFCILYYVCFLYFF